MSARLKSGGAALRHRPRARAAQQHRPTEVHEEAVSYRIGQEAQVSPDKNHPVHPVAPLRFIDLFCGIGGFRIAFERAGAKCVFSCDWDKHSQITYAANFGETPHGDIHDVAVADIPKFDILCAGFPCQPFSIAGVSKKLSLGRKHGFEDERQGNLFFDLAAIISFHQPPAFVLENVKAIQAGYPLRKIFARCSARNSSSGKAASSGSWIGFPAYAPKFSATARWEISAFSLGESSNLKLSSNEIRPRSKATS